MYKYYVYRIDSDGELMNDPGGSGSPDHQREAVRRYGYTTEARFIKDYVATLVLHCDRHPKELDLPSDDWDYWLYNREGQHIHKFGVLKEWLR